MAMAASVMRMTRSSMLEVLRQDYVRTARSKGLTQRAVIWIHSLRNALLRISEQADVSMQEALARRNAEVAAHEYEKIAIAVSKCEQLFAESEACVGELAIYAGETQVEVEVTGEPAEDLSEDIPEVEVITRPPAASPYQ
jgi:hypothetical protein